MRIAVFGYVTCYQTRLALRDQSGNEFGEDFGDESAMNAKPRRPSWLQRRRATRAAQQAEQERRHREQHRQLVEETLAKVSKSGLTSLSSSERTVLEEETRRQRALRGED
jgi:hypothetical protein